MNCLVWLGLVQDFNMVRLCPVIFCSNEEYRDADISSTFYVNGHFLCIRHVKSINAGNKLIPDLKSWSEIGLHLIDKGLYQKPIAQITPVALYMVIWYLYLQNTWIFPSFVLYSFTGKNVRQKIVSCRTKLNFPTHPTHTFH